MGEWDSENSTIGWARWLEKAGQRRKTAVLFSSFGLNSCFGDSAAAGLLNFHNERLRGTSNIESGMGLIRSRGSDKALRRRDDSCPSGPGLFTSFCTKTTLWPGGTKKLEGKKIRIPIFLSTNFFVIPQGHYRAFGRRDGSGPRGRGCSLRLAGIRLSVSQPSATRYQLGCPVRLAEIRKTSPSRPVRLAQNRVGFLQANGLSCSEPEPSRKPYFPA